MKKYLSITRDLCIVIPCYNEEIGFHMEEYLHFLNQNFKVILCFVNDGSKDNSLQIIKGLKQSYPRQVDFVSYGKNVGKAEAVRRGMIYCNENYNYTNIAYLDADLSTSLSECLTMKDVIGNGIEFAFGSRIMKIGSIIERKYSRFVIGRILAGIISWRLGLKVYDTQCGCKIFTKQLAQELFKEPFVSRWLFDVEIFHRLIIQYSNEGVLQKMTEVPLKKWIDRGESKVKPTYFFRLWYDLFKIDRQYTSVESYSLPTHPILSEDV